MFDIEILRLAAFFGGLFGCSLVVPIKVTETIVQWVARNALEIQTAQRCGKFTRKHKVKASTESSVSGQR